MAPPNHAEVALPGAVGPLAFEQKQEEHAKQEEPEEDTDDGSEESGVPSDDEDAIQGTMDGPTSRSNLNTGAVQAWSLTFQADSKRRIAEAQRTQHLEQVKEARLKNSKKLQPADAAAVLKETRFFADFEQVMPGVIQELAKLCLLQTAVEGEVLFRQDDPPQDCYIVTQGRVGVYQRKASQYSPRELVPEEVKVLEDSKGRRCCCFKKKAVETVKVIVDTSRRYVTEGYNTYTSESTLGQQLVELGKNSAFGELGLMEDKPRAASIRCEAPCTFLVIQKVDFVRLFGGSISTSVYKKKLYFYTNVPGFDKEKTLRISEETGHQKTSGQKGHVPSRMVSTISRRVHPTDHFVEEQRRKGHSFLEEGEVALPMIVVVKTGEVDFTRSCHENIFGQRRRSASGAVSFARLTAGQIFCSLPTFGFPGIPEQFTAQISSDECTYFIAKADNIKKLPERILSQIQEHIKEAMRPLLCYSGAFMGLDHVDAEHIPTRRPTSPRTDRQVSPPRSPAFYPERRPPSAKR